ncbi:MAG: hypothetical protein QOI13_1868, partial [Paraburkholderia sp.]|nr:hypothetical protein [Paraburkholderia sp.]
GAFDHLIRCAPQEEAVEEREAAVA